jgi:hypothetical protein
MRLAEIEVGKTYQAVRGYPMYGAKVTVIAGPGRRQEPTEYGNARGKVRGWLVEVVGEGESHHALSPPVGRTEFVMATKLDHEWGDADDQRVAEQTKEFDRVSALKMRVGSDRDISVLPNGQIVCHDIDASERLLERLGDGDA